MKPRISMVSLGVRDLQAAIRFYKEGLGWPMMDSPPSVAFFNLNGSWLGLCEREELAEDAGLSPEGRGFTGINLAHNVNYEHEVEEVINKVLKAGGTMIKPPQKASWGGYHAYFKDVDGHLWEVAHNPFGWIGPIDED